jgi:hypothetical protein
MSEHDTQCAFVTWCAWNESKHPELRLGFAVPNGGPRNIITAKKLKAEGVRSGVPDYCLPVHRGGYIALWIEFKFGKNKLSPAQTDYIERLKSHRHCVAVCYSVDEAISAVEGYLNPKHVMATY